MSPRPSSLLSNKNSLALPTPPRFLFFPFNMRWSCPSGGRNVVLKIFVPLVRLLRFCRLAAIIPSTVSVDFTRNEPGLSNSGDEFLSSFSFSPLRI